MLALESFLERLAESGAIFMTMEDAAREASVDGGPFDAGLANQRLRA